MSCSVLAVLARLPLRPLCTEVQSPRSGKLLLCELQSTGVPCALGPKDSVTHSALPYAWCLVKVQQDSSICLLKLLFVLAERSWKSMLLSFNRRKRCGFVTAGVMMVFQQEFRYFASWRLILTGPQIPAVTTYLLWLSFTFCVAKGVQVRSIYLPWEFSQVGFAA